MITRKKLKQLWTRFLIRIGKLPIHIIHREEKELQPQKHLSTNVTVYCRENQVDRVRHILGRNSVPNSYVTVQGCLDMMDDGRVIQIDFQDVRRQMHWYAEFAPLDVNVIATETFRDALLIHTIRLEKIDYGD